MKGRKSVTVSTELLIFFPLSKICSYRYPDLIFK